MNKRGQFYLIASLIIISLIIAFVTITNYSKKRDFPKAEKLKQELEFESEKVLDYTVKNPLNDADTDNLIEGNSNGVCTLVTECGGGDNSLTKKFDIYAGEDTEIYFVTGRNSASMKAYWYNQGTKANIQETDIDRTNPEKIKATIDSSDYEFDIKEGYNFYFVIIQKAGDEKYVVTN